MPQEPLTFHDQLLLFLQDDLKKKKNEEGWDDRYDTMMRNYSDAISHAIRSSAPIPLEEIINQHRYLFQDRGPIQLEQKLLLSFSDREMAGLEFKPLRIYRGLPRLYRKSQPQISRLKPNFSHLPSLKRLTALKPLFSLYGPIMLPANAKIAILSGEALDGSDDYYALEIAKLIKNAFPTLDLHLIVMSNRALSTISDCCALRWDGSNHQIDLLSRCDFVLQTSVSLKANEIKAQIEALCEGPSFPKWELLGQYGFLESDWFYPHTAAHSLGLHFLEKGILTHRIDANLTISELKNEQLSQWLFDQSAPSLEMINQYRQNHRFFLADLLSQDGIFVYLHALLKSLEKDSKDIDLCVLDPAKMLAFFEQRIQAKLDPIEKRYQIRQIVFHIGAHVAVLNIESTGKTIRILCPQSMSSSDFQRCLAFSEEFVACQSDQSLSEAVSINKCFFYDSCDNNRYFLKDLIALAQNRIPQHPSSIEVLRLFSKVFEHHLPQEASDWVDEIFIQDEKMDLLEIAETMGKYLQDPKTFAGLKKLNRILIEEHSCNGFILNLVQRAICHHCCPEIERIEQEELMRFSYGWQSFSSVVQTLRTALKT